MKKEAYLFVPSRFLIKGFWVEELIVWKRQQVALYGVADFYHQAYSVHVYLHTNIWDLEALIRVTHPDKTLNAAWFSELKTIAHNNRDYPVHFKVNASGHPPFVLPRVSLLIATRSEADTGDLCERHFENNRCIDLIELYDTPYYPFGTEDKQYFSRMDLREILPMIAPKDHSLAAELSSRWEVAEMLVAKRKIGFYDALSMTGLNGAIQQHLFPEITFDICRIK